jgi:signal transduction histidine kinase
MAAGFAHEINNPMSSIAGCTELLIDQLDSDELKKISQHDYFLEYLNIIYREAFRCRDIIRGMLRFSRKEFERGTININSLLKEVLSLLDYTIKVQKIHLVQEYMSSTNLLQADEGEIRQILLALIVNAIDVMPNGGTLTIKTQDLNENIHITIQDTGSGIAPQIRDKVFDPFFTTKSVGKGTGLGLFIAFNLLKKYHGKIELKSTGSTGSTFTVTLPIGTYTLSEQQ